MKFKVYNQTNSKNFIVGKPTLSVSERAGVFQFSKAASALIGLSEDQGIQFLQNEESKEDFYVIKETSSDAFKLRGKAGSSYCFNSVSLATLLLDRGEPKLHSVKLNRTAKFTVGPALDIDGINMHLIILSKP